MRGSDAMQESLFTVAKLDDFVPREHPLRAIRLLVTDVGSARADPWHTCTLIRAMCNSASLTDPP
jgi:hypothetical protein